MDGRVPSHTTDGDLEGLDESQRAEVHEYEGGGPNDGLVGMTIVSPEDLGDDLMDDLDEDDGDTQAADGPEPVNDLGG